MPVQPLTEIGLSTPVMDADQVSAFVDEKIELFNVGFFRGSSNNWAGIPTDPTKYRQDFNGNTTPKKNDYLVVYNSTDYTPADNGLSVLQIGISGGQHQVRVDIDGDQRVVQHSAASTGTGVLVGKLDELRIFYNDPRSSKSGRRDSCWDVYSNNRIISANGTQFFPGEMVCSFRTSTPSEPVLKLSAVQTLLGAWRFRYEGTWEDDGKSGWNPEYQVENMLPIAKSKYLGIVKPDNKSTFVMSDGTLSSIDRVASYRGTFNTWDDVLSSTDVVPHVSAGMPYLYDNVNSPVPRHNDYMFVADCSSYQGSPSFLEYSLTQESPVGGEYHMRIEGPCGYAIRFGHSSVINGNDILVGINNEIRIKYTNRTWYICSESSNVIYNGTEYGKGQQFAISINTPNVYSIRTVRRDVDSGTWMFRYFGSWESMKKDGWIPVMKTVTAEESETSCAFRFGNHYISVDDSGNVTGGRR